MATSEAPSGRIVFMGTPTFAVPVLERLLAGPYAVAAVYTRRDRPAGRGRRLLATAVKEVALARGLPIYQPATLRRPEEGERLRNLQPAAIVVAAYGLILPPAVLAIPPFGCLNVHPSLLPHHRGPAPVAGAILAGDRVTGVTIMLMDEGTDTGPILAQRELEILPHDTTGSLTPRLAVLGADLLREVLPRVFARQSVPQPQDEAQATYTHLFRKEEGEIDWTAAAEAIERRVRAFQPWPGCYTFWSEQRLLVLEAAALTAPPLASPGDVLAAAPIGLVAPSPFLVQTGEGLLALLRVQLEGRRALTGEEFLRGQAGVSGKRLGKI